MEERVKHLNGKRAYLLNFGGDELLVIADGPAEAITAGCQFYTAADEPETTPLDLERLNGVADEVILAD